jgi:hypothetical protein
MNHNAAHVNTGQYETFTFLGILSFMTGWDYGGKMGGPGVREIGN